MAPDPSYLFTFLLRRALEGSEKASLPRRRRAHSFSPRKKMINDVVYRTIIRSSGIQGPHKYLQKYDFSPIAHTYYVFNDMSRYDTEKIQLER